jgi:hypothetical protein
MGFFNFCYAQNEGNIWVFSDSAAIDFNTGTPVPLLGTGVVGRMCSSSICDANGQLLFYSGTYSTIMNGSKKAGVFNKYNELIQNGTEIYCLTYSSQGNLIIPFVNDSNFLYLFSHREDASVPDYKIYYSIIDKTANSDSGEVILKNVVLPGIGEMSEQLQAVRHGNGIDWWLITHKGNGNQYYLYLIDSSGINGPFIQSIGSSFPQFAAHGQMKLSPDGKKLVIVSSFGLINLFDFDRCTGIISNWISLGYNNFNIFYFAYDGCSFSPDSRLLYVSGEDTLFQFDLQSADIAASKQVIWNDNDSLNLVGQHLLGPDGKIYIANSSTSWYSNVFNYQNMYLSVINSPDSLGATCNFQPYSFNLGGRRTFGGLPNIPDYTLGPVEGACVVSVEEVEGKSILEVFPNPAQDILYIKGLDPGEKYQLLIYDVTGRIILTEKITSASVDIHQLTLGLYFYKIENNKSAIKSGRITIIK